MGHMRHQQIVMKFVSSKFRAKTLKNTIVRSGRKKFRKYRGFDLLTANFSFGYVFCITKPLLNVVVRKKSVIV